MKSVFHLVESRRVKRRQHERSNERELHGRIAQSSGDPLRLRTIDENGIDAAVALTTLFGSVAGPGCKKSDPIKR